MSGVKVRGTNPEELERAKWGAPHPSHAMPALVLGLLIQGRMDPERTFWSKAQELWERLHGLPAKNC